MKERLKMNRRAESRFVNVGACELPRISRCTFKAVLFLLDRDDSVCILKYANITDDKITHYRTLSESIITSIKNALDKFVILDFIKVYS